MEEKKSNKVLIIIVALMVGLLLMVAGWGFFNGWQTKTYAKRADKIYNQLANWEEPINSDELEDDVEDEIKKMKEETDGYIKELNGKYVPRKAKQLDKNLKEYLGEVKQVLKATGDLVGWFTAITDATTIGTDLSNVDPTNPDAMAQSMEKSKREMETAYAKLQTITPPKALKQEHEAYLKMLRESIPVYDKLIVAVRNNDLAALSSLSANSFESLENLNTKEDKTFEEILKEEYGADVARIEQLEKEIPTQISEIKNTLFTF